jgi:hypothetical protein
LEGPDVTDKRLVHDILSESGQGPNGEILQRRPVAFVQHGNREDGFQYEGVCPFCGETTCFVTAKLVSETIGGLYRLLLREQKAHWRAAPHLGKREFAVMITRKPLNTEKALPQ